MQVGAHLGAMMDLVFVDPKEEDGFAAAYLESFVRSLLLPAFEGKSRNLVQRVMISLFNLDHFRLQRFHLAQNGEQALRHAFLVVVPLPFQGRATNAFLGHPDMPRNLT